VGSCEAKEEIDGRSLQCLAPAEMNKDVSKRLDGRSLRCVATAGLGVSETGDTGASYERWAEERGNNYFRSAQW
jgi:hypothetical protein